MAELANKAGINAALPPIRSGSLGSCIVFGKAIRSGRCEAKSETAQHIRPAIEMGRLHHRLWRTILLNAGGDDGALAFSWDSLLLHQPPALFPYIDPGEWRNRAGKLLASAGVGP